MRSRFPRLSSLQRWSAAVLLLLAGSAAGCDEAGAIADTIGLALGIVDVWV